MNESMIGALITNTEKVEIKRRRKIHYRKPKSRLIPKPAGVLNKSLYKDNKQANESICNKSQLISVKDINSFLSRNRELAKALEESRSQAKEFEKQKVNFQSECIGIREKLSLYQKTILKCSCNKEKKNEHGGSYRALTNLEESMKQSLKFFNDYMTSVVFQTINFDKDNPVDQSTLNMHLSYFNEGPYNKATGADKSVQTDSVSTQNVRTQSDGIQTRNKKLQVNMKRYDVAQDAHKVECTRKHLHDGDDNDDDEENKVFDCKAVQCCLTVRSTTEHGTQCQISSGRSDNNNNDDDDVKKCIRKPLMVIKNENRQDRIKPCSILKSQTNNNCSTTKMIPSSLKPSFKIFEDLTNENKENLCAGGSQENVRLQKKVKIHSPAMIHFFEPSINEPPRSRQCKNVVKTYKEPNCNRKLTKLDPFVDTQFHESPYRKVRRSKKKKSSKRSSKKMNVTLEEVIQSVMEESFRTGGARKM